MNHQFLINNQFQNVIPRMNIIFKTSQGKMVSISFYYGTTVNQVLVEFLKKVGRTDLIGNKSNKVEFILNGKYINFNEQRKIEDFFQNVQNPILIVNLVNMINKSKTLKERKHSKYLLNFERNTVSNSSFNFHDNLNNHSINKNKIHQYESEIEELKKKLNEETIKKENEIEELKKQLNEEINKNKKTKKENCKLWQQNQMFKIIDEKLRYSKENWKNELNPGETLLEINFIKKGKENDGCYKFSCKNNELFVRLEERFYKDYPELKEYDINFAINGQKIKRFKTIDENQIKNNDLIEFVISNN